MPLVGRDGVGSQFVSIVYVSFPVILESIKIDKHLHVQLQYNGHAVPLPAWFTVGRNATLTRYSQLHNFPNWVFGQST